MKSNPLNTKVNFELTKFEVSSNLKSPILAKPYIKHKAPVTIYNSHITLVQNTRFRTIEELYTVMKYVARSFPVSKQHVLEVSPKTGLLHIHVKGFIKNKNFAGKKNNIYLRLKKYYPNYRFQCTYIQNEEHEFRIDNYDKQKTNEENALNLIKKNYCLGEWSRCPFCKLSSVNDFKTCTDFTINEAYSFYWYLPYSKNYLRTC